MFNLFDIMRNAQGGAAIDNMARQFGLTREQAQTAVDALLPAFTLSLQRNAMNPNAMAGFFGMLGSGQHAGFFDNSAPGFSPQAQAQGNAVLGQLFGSPDVSRQVANQAAAMTGIGAEILKQMLPYIAATLVGGLFRSASNQGFSGMFGQMMEMMRGGGQPTPTGPGPNPGGRMGGPIGSGPMGSPAGGSSGPFGPWGDILGNIFGGASGQGVPRSGPQGYNPDPAPSPRSAPGSFEESVGSLLDGDRQTGPRGGTPQGNPQGSSSGSSPDLAAAWGQVFQTGREVQEQHLDNLKTIFDSFWGGNRPSR